MDLIHFSYGACPQYSTGEYAKVSSDAGKWGGSMSLYTVIPNQSLSCGYQTVSLTAVLMIKKMYWKNKQKIVFSMVFKKKYILS